MTTAKKRGRAQKRVEERDAAATATGLVVVPVPRNEVATSPARQAEDVEGDAGTIYRNEVQVIGQPAEVATRVGPGIGLLDEPPSSRGDLTPPSSGDYVLGAARLA